MKIAVLTSSRADFGVYLPLLNILKNDDFFELEIIAFGTHLSKDYGYTINEINQSNFKTVHHIETPLNNSSAFDISRNIGETISIFASFWSINEFDYIIALGDRYEMFAAVTATTPFNCKVAHLHAGETTLGAIDNVYRHAISLMSNLLFVSTNIYKQKAIHINPEAQTFNVGALSIENLKKVNYLSIKDFQSKFKIDLSLPTILCTFHPETVNLEKNEDYIYELLSSFSDLIKKYQIIITLPNADTIGDQIRDIIINYGEENFGLKIVDSFGMIGYLSCMKYCKFMLGNTSSGFVEASFFPKWVINIGNRQDGRIITQNIINIPIQSKAILQAVKDVENKIGVSFPSIYGDGETALKITEILKKEYEKL
ncbi:UDP-N-acetylglucosamine 2-epimerase [Kaistella antarctica]|uniref:Polysialic acid biosynthesis protein P7 n=1 Tax=Kaistella antarctica TaxID=266748 RepID=A0A448NRE5_9FLAO|nr:UDP-N-acetylglucosamine 2-epimerase [Kaistella antarctica]KEY18816.1 UDP-N-acetyl-D-glucosamine 2-epimerase [Kaistella antarctica]SEW15100.1 GDP/UDP-N,N'-diacetylbacillosamine 2-epimerase (hydrolysing) [Kaistella antarctica]VEH99444.1 Polysialic acid biosynthesis protein P7 [Kaistella antarctica]